eukprot:1352485-Pyramimonas_sp.AAC.1
MFEGCLPGRRRGSTSTRLTFRTSSAALLGKASPRRSTGASATSCFTSRAPPTRGATSCAARCALGSHKGGDVRISGGGGGVTFPLLTSRRDVEAASRRRDERVTDQPIEV